MKTSSLIQQLLIYSFLLFGFLSNAQNIALTYPINGERCCAIRSLPVFTWQLDLGAPISRSYNMVIKKVLEGQTFEEAYAQNDTAYFRKIPLSDANYERGVQLEVVLELQETFVWKVIAEDENNNLLGESEVHHFLTGWIITEFYASRHRITVDSLSNKDLNDLSGLAKIRLINDADAWRPIEFTNFNIDYSGGYGRLVGGEISIDTTGVLQEVNDRNSAAFSDLTIDTYYINKSGLSIDASGEIHIPMLDTTVSLEIKRANFDNFKITGTGFVDSLVVEIADGFVYDFKSLSSYVNDNEYQFRHESDLLYHIDGIIPTEGFLVDMNFQSGDLNQSITSTLVKNTPINILVDDYTIDFSLTESDASVNGPEWTGVLIKSFGLQLLANSEDSTNQVFFDKHFETYYPAEEGTMIQFSPDGIELNLVADLISDSLSGQLYHYPAKYESIELSISGNNYDNSFLKGQVEIPALSSELIAIEIPITADGFSPAWLELNGQMAPFTQPYVGTTSTSLVGLRITWYPVDNVTSYKLYASEDNFTSYLEGYDGKVVQDTTALIKVTSETFEVKIGIENSESNIISIDRLNAPSNIKAFILPNGALSVVWDDNSNNEDGYLIEMLDPVLKEYTQFGVTTANVAWFEDSNFNPNTGVRSYRLAAFNSKAKSSYGIVSSENASVITLDIDRNKELSIQFYPNPYQDRISIINNGESNLSLLFSYQLIDVLGKVILSGHSNLGNIAESINQNTPMQDPGVYYLKLSEGGKKENHTIKLMKK